MIFFARLMTLIAVAMQICMSIYDYIIMLCNLFISYGYKTIETSLWILTEVSIL